MAMVMANPKKTKKVLESGGGTRRGHSSPRSGLFPLASHSDRRPCVEFEYIGVLERRVKSAASMPRILYLLGVRVDLIAFRSQLCAERSIKRCGKKTASSARTSSILIFDFLSSPLPID